MTQAMATVTMAATRVIPPAFTLTTAILFIRRRLSTDMGRGLTTRCPAICRLPYCNSITVTAADIDIMTAGDQAGAVATAVFVADGDGARAADLMAAAGVAMVADNYWRFTPFFYLH